MEQNFDKLASVQKANTEALMALIRTAFNGIERLTALNMAASRDFFSQNLNNAQQICSVKNTEELSKINLAFSQPNIAKWVDYSRNLYDLLTEIQKEITGIIRSQYSEFSEKVATENAEQIKSKCPVGGEFFANSMKSLLNFSNQTFSTMTEMAKQFREIAEGNLKEK